MGVELTPEEIDQYMQMSPRVILCITREGKSPLAVPMWFGWIDGKIYMNTAQASKKIAYIRKNPLVSCLVESGDDYYTLKSVLFMGHCEIIEDQEEVERYGNLIWEAKAVNEANRPKRLPPHLEKFYAQARAYLIVTPHSVTTWDFSKIRL